MCMSAPIRVGPYPRPGALEAPHIMSPQMSMIPFFPSLVLMIIRMDVKAKRFAISAIECLNIEGHIRSYCSNKRVPQRH